MNRNAYADRNLLGPHGKTLGAHELVRFNKNVAATQNQMFALARTDRITP